MHRWILGILSILALGMVIAATRQVWRLTQDTSHTPVTQSTTTITAITPHTESISPTLQPSPTTILVDTETPTTTIAPTIIPTPTLFPSPQAYIAYRVKTGDTLAAIAQASGSNPDYIAAFNRFIGEPEVLRPLIIPQIDAHASTLASQAILVQRGANRSAVALTFDAGAESTPTTAILDTLALHHVHVTFFLTGEWVKKNPELTRRIIADGHEVANHSQTHPDFRQLDDAAITKELLNMAQAFFDATGIWPAPYFRPPFGAYDERVLRAVIANGYLPIFWTLDSLDSVGETKSADFIVDRLTNTLAANQLNGAILLCHIGNASTAEALPRILEEFAKRGIIVTTLSQIL
jgi:peptidoglycan/xylan/chitin deacetylase (PgdA/CDA1 family)